MPSFPDMNGLEFADALDDRMNGEDGIDPYDFENEPISREVLGLPELPNPEPFPMLKKTNKKPRTTKNATVPVFMRFSDLKCNSPKCKKCNPPKEEVMQGINHRLFSNNRSTATHWFPGKPESGRKPILISDLTPDHLAAIVDQYEGEALKFIEENIRTSPKFMTEAAKRSSPITQNFLTKNVAAWPAIKNAEWKFRRNSPLLYNKLFVEKRYNVGASKTDPVNPFLNYFFDLSFLKNRGIVFDIETPLNREEYMNKEMPKVEYKPNATISVSPTERERAKARINLRLTQIKLQQKEINKAGESIRELTLQIEQLMNQL